MTLPVQHSAAGYSSMTGLEHVVVALVGMSAPGYRSHANAYLRESLKADTQLPDVWVADIEFTTDTSPWWVAYRVLALDPSPHILGFSVYCWNAEAVYHAIRLIAASNPSIRIVLGGPEVGPQAESVLEQNPAVFAVAHAEGERTLPMLVRSLIRGGDPEATPGLTVRTPRGIVRGPEATPVERLDSVPSAYTDSHPPATDGSAFIETYRGCPHNCAYCYEGKGVSAIRSFSWDRIAADIERVATTPGMRSFSFIDSVFNLTPDRLERLADLLEPHAKRGTRLHTIEVDIERIDDAAAAHLVRAGVVSVETGPQTTCPRALAATNRTFNPEAYRAGVEACRRAGISVEADLIIGLPGDTVDSVLESMRFAISVDPGVVQSSTLHVLPGTQLWDSGEELGLRWDHRAPHEIIETPTLSFQQLRQLEVFGAALGEVYRAHA